MGCMEEHKKVAIYTRVSTEEQAKEGFSLDAQLEKLKSYCHARDWTIYDEFIDEGFSGTNVKRPAYQRLLDEIENWDVLLVMKMDRMHRNSKNFMIMMEELKKNNKEFVSMMESLDTSTAMGRFVMDIIQRIAQLESEQIGERVYIGMEQKAKHNGGILGFNIPYGYDYRSGKLLINKEESKNVKKIFDLYLNGLSMKKIADHFNEEKIPTKLNKKWGSQTIALILKNPVYCGYLQWEDYIYPNDHDLIIDSELYNTVQEIIKQKNKKNTNSNIQLIV